MIKCEFCGKRQTSLTVYDRHREVRHSGQKTMTSKVRNEPVDFGDVSVPGHTMTLSSTPSSSVLESVLEKKEEGQGQVIERVILAPLSGPAAERSSIEQAVEYLYEHRDHLAGRELSFVCTMKGRAARGRSLSRKEQDWLLDIEAGLRGLVEQETERNRRADEFMVKAKHPLALKDPAHNKTTCPLCIEAVEADKRAEDGLIQEIIEANTDRAKRGLVPLPIPERSNAR